MMNLSEFSNSQRLQEILLHKIEQASSKRITFAQYMDTILYDQKYGYYNCDRVAIGSQGDFFTSSSLSKDFGELLAIQFQQMWHKLGCPNPFYLIEMGAGNGELAQDILGYLSSSNEPTLTEAVRYIIIEQSASLKAKQQQLLQPFNNFKLAWKTWSDIGQESIVGCFFANELVDAFPIHLISKKDNQLQEVFLSIQDNKLTEIIDRLSSFKLAQYFDLIGIDISQPEYPEGYRSEVNLQALDWIDTIADKLKRGYIMTIDYGYSADKYYQPARSQGTLQCYYQHRYHNNPYVNLGYQDVTAHVDFTALKRQGELANLQTIGFTQQGLFLMALGLGDRLNALANGNFNLPEIFKRRNALHQLIDPTGLGGFGVLIQGKNLSKSEQSLQGLNIPHY